MSFEKSVIVTGYTAFSDVKEHTLEADMVLPDYFSNINKVLKFSVTPYEEMVTFSGDRVSVAGIAMINLLYVGEDNKLCSYDNEIKYTKVVPAVEAENNDSVKAEQYVQSLNYRVLGPKRIELRAALAVKIQIERMRENSILTQIDDDKIQKKCGEITQLKPHCICCRDLSIRETVPAGDMKNTVYILRSAVRCSINESKAIKNKLMVKGNCRIEAVYVTAENNVASYSYDLPFTEVVEALGLEDSDRCDIAVCGACCKVSLTAAGSEKCELDTMVKLKLHITGLAEVSLLCFEDAYSTQGNAENSFVETDLVKAVKEISESVPVSMTADTYGEGTLKICDCYADTVTASLSKAADGTLITGSVNFNALLVDAENHYSLISRSTAFEYMFSGEMHGENDCLCELESSPVSAALKNAGKIEFSSDIKITLHITEKIKTKMISDISVSAAADAAPQENVVLYFGRKGERLWDIAKSNFSSIDIIKESNNITDDCLSEDKLLIFANF